MPLACWIGRRACMLLALLLACRIGHKACTPLSHTTSSADSCAVTPMSTPHRKLILPRCGLLYTLVRRLACSFDSPPNLEYEKSSYSALLRRLLNVAQARKLLKSLFLQNLNADRASKQPQCFDSNRHTPPAPFHCLLQ